MSARSVDNDVEGRGMACDELLSLEALLVSRAYLYTLFHKVFGGEPDERLLKLVAASTTEDVLDEYAEECEVLAKLKGFVSVLGQRLSDGHFIAEIRDEYTRFFQGPADLPALPWESAHIGNERMVFQASTLAVREAYCAQGLRLKLCGRMPDDHVSVMCAFMGILAKRALKAFRTRNYEVFRRLMLAQYSFACQHMTNWLPEYSLHALRVQKAFLYPQFAQGVAAFVEVDEVFCTHAIRWVDDAVSVAEYAEAHYSSERYFGEAEAAMSELSALVLRGIEENELTVIGERSTRGLSL